MWGVVENMAQTNANLIWKIADLLRGPYQPNQYGDVILPFTILRRLDCILEPTKDEVLADSAQTEATQLDADLVSELIASGVTTQPVEIVIAVLVATRGGASINAAAKASGINYRTAQRIVEAAAERRQWPLVAVG
jgi:hypothetical protein